MNVSVVICTYNRDGILGDTLRSFLSVQEPPGLTVELLIVDNGSTDGTAKVTEEFVAGWPGKFRYVFEPTSGLSVARNRGIAETPGSEVVAFVDDDIYFDGQWLIAMLQEFATHPGAMCVGGRSIPVFEAGEPAWISDRIRYAYGSTNSGDVPKQMTFPEHPFGLNMAFRREVFARVGLFNTNLGRKGQSLLSNEETDYFSRVAQAGLIVRYAPDAVVMHRISAGRAQRRWVLRRYYWQGVSEVVFTNERERLDRGDRLRRAYWASRRMPAAAGGVLKQAVRGRLLASQGMDAMIRLSSLAGEVKQWVRESIWT